MVPSRSIVVISATAMDLTGQLCNLPGRVLTLFNLRRIRDPGQLTVRATVVPVPITEPRFRPVQRAIVSVLTEEGGELRMTELTSAGRGEPRRAAATWPV